MVCNCTIFGYPITNNNVIEHTRANVHWNPNEMSMVIDSTIQLSFVISSMIVTFYVVFVYFSVINFTDLFTVCDFTYCFIINSF
jgi:hypothetical protein